jgi:hypothetical protein
MNELDDIVDFIDADTVLEQIQVSVTQNNYASLPKTKVLPFCDCGKIGKMAVTQLTGTDRCSKCGCYVLWTKVKL